MAKINLTILKKNLAKKSKEELVQEISTLYKNFSNVKEYYQAQGGNINIILEKYKDTIKKEFVDGYTRDNPKARLSVAKKAVQDFNKFTQEPKLLADIMLTFVESVSDFNTAFGVDGESYYTSPEDVFEKVLKLLKENNLLPIFKERAYDIVNSATDGWGHFDSLSGHYEDFYGEFIR